MTFTRIMGLNVIDDNEYQNYREGMEPILKSHDANFGYDFKIAKVLRSKTASPINRVFSIEFPSKEVMTTFFSHPEYLKIKEKHFAQSVESITTIALFEESVE